MVTFQRARSAEQRAARRDAILATAAAMLTEMPVADVSLNELSRRVGLAKSNVLNYFDSREAVLLELSGLELTGWVDDLADALDQVHPEAPIQVRAEQLVETVVDTLVARPVLCDLISAQASVLERNISTETALTFKRAAVVSLERMIEVVLRALPELGPGRARDFIAAASMFAGAIWTHAHPVPAIIAAYEADPAVGALRMEFEPTLRDNLRLLLYGVLPRAKG
ncbi:TetR family transcriptional regulator [Kribbella sp. NPDC055071]